MLIFKSQNGSLIVWTTQIKGHLVLWAWIWCRCRNPYKVHVVNITNFHMKIFSTNCRFRTLSEQRKKLSFPISFFLFLANSFMTNFLLKFPSDPRWNSYQFYKGNLPNSRQPDSKLLMISKLIHSKTVKFEIWDFFKDKFIRNQQTHKGTWSPFIFFHKPKM